MVIYICSPYSGDIENNTKNAKTYCRFAVKQGHTPFAPHLLYPQFLSGATDRKKAMKMDLEMLGRCDAVWVFGTAITKGMREEIIEAVTLGKPVKRVTESEMSKPWWII